MAVTVGRFAFTIGVTRDGEPVHRAPVSVAACLEDAVFRAVVSGQISNDGNIPSHLITPVWSGEDPPAVAALELRLGDLPVTRYDTDVVAPQARALIKGLIKDGTLTSDGAVDWQLDAHEAPAAKIEPHRFSARVSRAPLPLESVQLPSAAPGEFSVEFDHRLLTELSDAVASADAVERAWLLLGSICHDRSRGAAELRVRGAVPVETGRGGASQHHFAFDPATFVAARRAAVSTMAGAIPIGWSHSHPPCAECRATNGCLVDTRFFSTDDVEVHSTAFTSPYTVGLVIGKVGNRPAAQLGFRLYGWQKAQIRERDYRVSEI